ncbi:MAG: sodium/proton-translocating pyrophosphatase [Clostridia bacterium]|nr:sodium/proton-translocating pyrophosphatase [Clostridia bacterium]
MNYMDYAPFYVLVAAILALIFAAYKFFAVKKLPEGTPAMSSISSKIRSGAMAYLKRQYKTVGIFFAVMFVILSILAATDFLTPFVPFAFLSGGLFSGLSGFVGMKIATAANSRTANACQEGLNRGLRVAF